MATATLKIQRRDSKGHFFVDVKQRGVPTVTHEFPSAELADHGVSLALDQARSLKAAGMKMTISIDGEVGK